MMHHIIIMAIFITTNSKLSVLNDPNSFTRPTIGKELDACIEKRNDSLAGKITLTKKNNNNHGRSEKEV